MSNIKRKNLECSILCPAVAFCFLLFPSDSSRAQEHQVERDLLIAQLESHAANKQKVFDVLDRVPTLARTQCFAMDDREIRRSIIMDGEYRAMGKRAFLENAARRCRDRNDALFEALRELSKSHQNLFGSGGNADLMVRSAGDPAFRPYGCSMSLAEAVARMTEGNEAEVQAFQTIFETGQNTRGYVHKLECHAGVVEFVYAVTDIVYGVMLPGELEFGPERVVADPTKVRPFFVPAGQVVALHPYVLHSGSLSVEPDRSFSVIIYKKPVTDNQQIIALPAAWQKGQDCLKIAGVDKFYLTLDELHTEDLKTNRGFITAKRPIRLPTWEGGGI